MQGPHVPAWAKVVLFLFVAMPLWFLTLIYISAFIMQGVAGWDYDRSQNFMASAYTGGAIVMPHDPPTETLHKIVASMLGASGVGMFGFMVAILLNSGLTAPIILVFGLNEPEANIFKGFLGVNAVAVLVMTFFCAIFGCIMHLAEGWPWFTAMKTIASVELGGGVVYREMGQPTSEGGTLLFCVVGCWAIGIAALLIAMAGEAFGNHVQKLQEKMGFDTGDESAALKQFAILCGIILPVSLCAACFVVAGAMAAFTAWDYVITFWVALPAVTGGAAVLHANTNPRLDPGGALLMFYVSTVGFLTINITMGIGAHLIGPTISKLPFFGEKNTVPKSVLALFIICFICIPACVYIFAFPVGLLIAKLQGWPFADGFWWCVAVQCGGGMALTGVMPENTAGRWIGMMAAAWSIGISIIAMGLSGAPALEPLMVAMGMDVRDEVKPLLEGIETMQEEALGGLKSANSTFDLDTASKWTKP